MPRAARHGCGRRLLSEWSYNVHLDNGLPDRLGCIEVVNKSYVFFHQRFHQRLKFSNSSGALVKVLQIGKLRWRSKAVVPLIPCKRISKEEHAAL